MKPKIVEIYGKFDHYLTKYDIPKEIMYFYEKIGTIYSSSENC